MQGVPIKFRGRTLTADKDFVYGDLIQFPYDLPIIRVHDYANSNEDSVAYDDSEVYPESVAQLVGYDTGGNEVYEGDTLIDSRGNEFRAELWAMGTNALDAEGLNNGSINFFLKKENDND